MATELAKAYVQIIPSAKGIKGQIESEMGGEAQSAGESSGNKFAGAFKNIIAAAGLGAALKESLLEGADLQQSIGGIETLFKDSADTVKAYAANAYQTAGMSANQYMETVTGFSASLLQSMGNDTAAAAEKANMALTDMSDNANKMGTDMEDIKNAYQGFAKQNYTMLDNLKLGYGGTKEEMERLLADAQAISGVEYDVSSYADVVDAIHVIQTKMDITGTTAKEASETFSGSMAAMKAAAKDLIGNLSLGEDIGPSLAALQETTCTFLVGNFFPMVGNILSGLPQVIGTALSAAVEAINITANNADQIVAMGIELVTGIAEAVISAAPYLIEAAVNLLAAFGRALIETDWGAVASNLINNIRDSMSVASGEIFGSDAGIITAVGDSITNNLPALLGKGVEIITNVATGILDAIPGLITTAGTMVQQFISFVMENLPVVLEAGAELAANLGQAIMDALPEVFTAIGETISGVLGELVPTDSFDSAIESILGIMESLYDGAVPIFDAIGSAIETVIGVVSDLDISWTDVWNEAGETLSVVGDLISTVIAYVSEVITEKINAVVDVIKWLSEQMNTEGTLINTIWDTMKTSIGVAIDEIQGIIQVLTSLLKGDWAGAWEAAKGICNTVWEGLKTVIGNALNFVKTKISTALETVKGFFTDKLGAAKNIVTDIFDSIKKKITDKIEGARDIVKKAIEKIKGFFNFSWSMPKLKLPHISITGKFSLSPPSVPKFGISWYGKAMDNAMLLNGATIFGMSGNTLLGGGEKGQEVVAGAGTLMDMIRNAVSTDYRESGTGRIEQLIERILLMLDGSLGTNIIINGADYKSKRELAEAVAELLMRDVTRKEAANA